MTETGSSTPQSLTLEELAEYRRFDTTTLFFARAEIEGFISEDFTSPDVRACFPELGPMVGYAATSEWTTMDPSAPDLDYVDYYEWLAAQARPSVAVMKDVDARAGRGSGFGEMQARTVKRLGCIGVLAGVGLHDVKAVQAQKLPIWTTSISPAHGPYHVVRFGAPVVIGSVTWRTGDVIVADESGAIRIPAQIARDVLRRAADLDEKDAGYFAVVDAPDFTLAKLRAWMAGHQSIYPPVDPRTAAEWWANNRARLEQESPGLLDP